MTSRQDDRLDELERLNLEYMALYIRFKPPSGPLRTFLDDWFAYHSGGSFLNRNLRPHWFNNPSPTQHGEALLSMHFVSAAASEIIQMGKQDRLMKDHAVPIKVITEKLFELKEPTIGSIRNTLLRCYRLGVITKEEDQRLNALKMRSTMPPDWDGEDPFARYARAEIVGTKR